MTLPILAAMWMSVSVTHAADLAILPDPTLTPGVSPHHRR
jgi:hypothetical protein